ncbi:MAG: hypothetical protein FD180_386 [Planctomycetota bacterium]|nr:MAG: hypothetical protein FD180_386 [Planctomycetota bacterium]
MLFTIREFERLATRDIDTLVGRLQRETGRFGDDEKYAWTESLPCVAASLKDSDLGGFHIKLGGSDGSLSLEYRLPASSSWSDLVLLGAGHGKPSAVVVELKHWSTSGDLPGVRSGLIRHNGQQVLHPSEQVRGYVEYFRAFHSAVIDKSADISGCVLFTNSKQVEAYGLEPHVRLVRDFPYFSASPQDLGERFPAFLRSKLRKPDEAWAREFENGVYQQDRGLVQNVARLLAGSALPQFVLVDGQRQGLQLVLAEVDKLLCAAPDKKVVMVVEGPPGSGKSVLGARLWAELALDERITGNIAFVTTSGSQKSNWMNLFMQATDQIAAKGLVLPANKFNPGLTPLWIKKHREAGKEIEISKWKQNLQVLAAQGGIPALPDNHLAVSIVDEAHALIDPTAPGAEGVPQSGWTMHAGPQAWHIIRASRLSVFLMDSRQSFRDNETTLPESIEGWAREWGAEVAPRVSLEGAQFRCAGSKEYVEWIQELFKSGQPGTPRWKTSGRRGFSIELVGDPFDLEARLQSHLAEGRTARLLATYGREWRTKNINPPHLAPPQLMDFRIPCEREGKPALWVKPWNFAPDMDYTLWVQAPAGSAMHANPLAEVGCPYVARGFDFDYVGLLWLNDLVWRTDRWVPEIGNIHETAIKRTLGRAQKERFAGRFGAASKELLERLIRAYRILLTRPLRGAYVWCEDAETRRKLEEVLGH